MLFAVLYNLLNNHLPIFFDSVPDAMICFMLSDIIYIECKLIKMLFDDLVLKNATVKSHR